MSMYLDWLTQTAPSDLGSLLEGEPAQRETGKFAGLGDAVQRQAVARETVHGQSVGREGVHDQSIHGQALLGCERLATAVARGF